MLNLDLLKKKIKEEAKVQVLCEPEDMPIKGNVIASGDDAYDQECENRILAQLEAGNEWAWCCTHVLMTWKGLTAHDYLGGCSYSSQEDFEKDGYYADMVDTCLDSLVQIVFNLQFENLT